MKITNFIDSSDSFHLTLTYRSEPCADVGKSRAIALYSDLEQLKNNLEIRWERFLWIKKTRMFINSITITSLSCKRFVVWSNHHIPLF